MALDKVLINHLEKQDELENAIEEEIESLISGLDIKDLISNAEEVLLSLVEKVQQSLKDSYYLKSSENGIVFAKDIIDDGDIKVTDSNNPTLNEKVLDVNGENKS